MQWFSASQARIDWNQWSETDQSAVCSHSAPFVYGIDPTTNDLYGDENNATFLRDMRMLRALGATTLVLEPTNMPQAYHQGVPSDHPDSQ